MFQHLLGIEHEWLRQYTRPKSLILIHNHTEGRIRRASDPAHFPVRYIYEQLLTEVTRFSLDGIPMICVLLLSHFEVVQLLEDGSA